MRGEARRVCLVIVRDEDLVGDLLGDHVASLIFHCEDHLETLLLALMPAVTCNPHGRSNMH